VSQFDIAADKGYYNFGQIKECMDVKITSYVPEQSKDAQAKKGLCAPNSNTKQRTIAMFASPERCFQIIANVSQKACCAGFSVASHPFVQIAP